MGTATAQSQAPAVSDSTNKAKGFSYRFDLEGTSEAGLRSRLLSISALHKGQKERLLSYSRLQSRLSDDLKAFRALLRSEGYYGARLTGAIRRAGQTPVARISVTPGPRYTIERIDIAFSGDDKADPALREALRERLTLRVGAPLRAETVIAEQARLRQALPELGYPYARGGQRDVVVDHAKQSAELVYRFAPGPKVRYGPIRYSGLDSVEQDYLDRLRPWQQGTAYTQGEVTLFQRRLSRTGLFDMVQVGPVETPEATPPMIVEAREADHRTISVGAGFSTNTGPGGDVVWEHRNLLGSAEHLRVTARAAQIDQALTAEFTKPHFRRLHQSLVLDATLKRQDTDAFTERTATLGAGLERRLSPLWQAGIGLELTYTDITQDGGGGEFGLAALPVDLRYDDTGDLLNPRKGYRLTLRAQPHGGLDSGQFFFQRNEIMASAYWPLDSDKRWVLAGRVRAGALVGAETGRIPANRRFFAGGGGSIRGFGFQDVGPKDADGDPLGGRSVAEVGAEIRWQISQSIGLVPFVEAGNVYTDTLPGFGGLKYGAGLGLRYYTAFGPIRLDIATPVNPGPDDRPVQFYISIGQSF